MSGNKAVMISMGFPINPINPNDQITERTTINNGTTTPQMDL